MDLVGRWKFFAMLGRDEAFNPVWEQREELLKKLEPGDDMLFLINSEMIFNEDGTVLSITKLPPGVSKEEIDAAVAAGKVELYGDDMMVLEHKSWKEENGKLLYDTGIKGEVFGEEVSPWVEIEQLEGGIIELPMMRYIKE